MSKEFEKWWKVGDLYDFPDFEPNEDPFVKGCRQGWRAALKWALRLHYNTALDTIAEIEKELKNE